MQDPGTCCLNTLLHIIISICLFVRSPSERSVLKKQDYKLHLHMSLFFSLGIYCIEVLFTSVVNTVLANTPIYTFYRTLYKESKCINKLMFKIATMNTLNIQTYISSSIQYLNISGFISSDLWIAKEDGQLQKIKQTGVEMYIVSFFLSTDILHRYYVYIQQNNQCWLTFIIDCRNLYPYVYTHIGENIVFLFHYSSNSSAINYYSPIFM